MKQTKTRKPSKRYEAVAKERERAADVAQFWGECECGSAETPLAIADAIRKGE